MWQADVVYNETLDRLRKQSLYFIESPVVPPKNQKVEGKKHGHWIKKFANGKVESEGRYNNGRKTGEWKYYNEDDFLTKEENYWNGKKDGEWNFYDEENGKLIKQKYYEKGKKSEELRYSYWNNGLEKEILRNSKWSDFEKSYWYSNRKIFNEQGQLIEEIDDKNIVNTRNIKKWNEDGILVEDINYKYYREKYGYHKNGKSKTYYKDGKPFYFADYGAGRLHGVVKSYDENGAVDITYWKSGKQTETYELKRKKRIGGFSKDELWCCILPILLIVAIL